MKYILVFVGGGLGSVMRFSTAKFFTSGVNAIFPFATLTVNAVSSFILGMLAAHLLQRPQADTVWLFLAVGFCGGFSTFSAFTLELFQFIRDGMIGLALLNIAVSVIICLIALWFGFTLIKN